MVPKISAPTVAEHRGRQRESLLAAATDLLVTSGVKAVTLAAVGSAVGLARPSVYLYFRSRTELLAAVVEESFPPSIAALDEALQGADNPRDVIDVYIRETLSQAGAGAHRVASALSGTQLSPAVDARIAELHHLQMLPFLDAMQELEVEEVVVTAQLLGGMMQAAMTSVEAGADHERVARRAITIAHSVLEPR